MAEKIQTTTKKSTTYHTFCVHVLLDLTNFLETFQVLHHIFENFKTSARQKVIVNPSRTFWYDACKKKMFVDFESVKRRGNTYHSSLDVK